MHMYVQIIIFEFIQVQYLQAWKGVQLGTAAAAAVVTVCVTGGLHGGGVDDLGVSRLSILDYV